MRKIPKIDTYSPVVYPRLLFVTTDAEGLDKYFEFMTIAGDYDDGGGYNRLLKTINEENPSGAVTCPVMRKSDFKYGVLVIVLDLDDITPDVIPHEAVHVADYICSELDIYTQDFKDGNESYAYLVGWAAGSISKTVSNRLKEKEHDD